MRVCDNKIEVNEDTIEVCEDTMGVCEDRIEVGEDTMGVCEYFYLSVGFKASWWGFLGKLRGF